MTEQLSLLALSEPVYEVDVAFWSRVAVGDGTGCWIHLGVPNADGYGRVQRRFEWGTLQTRAHRYAYMQLVGPIPPGFVIDHLCRNRLCCNPAHLEVVTNWQNVIERGQSPTALAHRSAVCKRGHALTGPNVYLVYAEDGSIRQRVCKACRRMREKADRKQRTERSRLRVARLRTAAHEAVAS